LGSDPLVRCNNRRDVLRANTAIFKEHGLALDRVGKPTTKVIVVANPSATNALIVSACAKSLPKVPVLLSLLQSQLLALSPPWGLQSMSLNHPLGCRYIDRGHQPCT
jgi:hypothetical protein